MVSEMIEAIAKELVDKMDEVRVTAVDGEHSTIYELRVAAEDKGKVIGRKGHTASSIRNLLDSIGVKQGRRLALDIID